MKQLGLLLVVAGGLLAATGMLLLLAGRLPFLGSLPGDIHARGKNWSFSFPLTTCILLSLVLTVLFNIVLRLMKK